jgi:hypothetical protein
MLLLLQRCLQAAAQAVNAGNDHQQGAAGDANPEDGPEQVQAEDANTGIASQQAEERDEGTGTGSQQAAAARGLKTGDTVVVDGTFYKSRTAAAIHYNLLTGEKPQAQWRKISKLCETPDSGWFRVKPCTATTAGAGVVIANKFFASIQAGQDWLGSLVLSPADAAAQGLAEVLAAADRWAAVLKCIAKDEPANTWRFCYVEVVPPEQATSTSTSAPTSTHTAEAEE